MNTPAAAAAAATATCGRRMQHESAYPLLCERVCVRLSRAQQRGRERERERDCVLCTLKQSEKGAMHKWPNWAESMCKASERRAAPSDLRFPTSRPVQSVAGRCGLLRGPMFEIGVQRRGGRVSRDALCVNTLCSTVRRYGIAPTNTRTVALHVFVERVRRPTTTTTTTTTWPQTHRSLPMASTTSSCSGRV
jgi:hypothetical protein